MSYSTSGYPGSYNDPYGNYSTRGYGGTTSANRAVIITEKMDEELASHIKKALSTDETAPKQKHVRACIVYTWDVKGSGSLWAGLRGYPMVGDEVVIFKALITIHKVVNQGHAAALRDISHDHVWVEQLSRSVSGHRGYAGLIKTYIQFLVAKLDYHRIHPEFSGSFDYEEYVTLKGVEDPNEGFETINDLLGLIKKINKMATVVFDNFRPGVGNECRIAALVPLVEESYGIYQFLVNMLTAMHQIIGSPEVLAPLRENFNQSHYALYKFYYECSGIRYLTSLITIPKLDKSPPDFLNLGGATPRRVSRPITPPPPKPPSEPEFDMIAMQQAELEAQIRAENQRLEAQRLEELERQRKAQEELQAQIDAQRLAEQQRQMELQRQAALLEQQRRQEEERLRQIQMQQMQHQQQALESQQQNALLNTLRNQNAKDREMIDMYEKRVKTLEQQLQSMSLNTNDVSLKSLQEELNSWKQKYEALAKLYAQLRKEHLDLLNKFKEVKDGQGKVSDEARKEMDKLKGELKLKSRELTDILVERDRLKGEADRVKAQYEEEIARIRKDLNDTKSSLVDMSKNKGEEMAAIVQRFNAEKGDLEELVKTRQRTIDDLRMRLDQATGDLTRVKASKDEESSVLQSGLDQTLVALAQLQKTQHETETTLLAQIQKLQREHLDQLSRMMDNILQTCIVKVDEAVYELITPTFEGNITASPSYVQSLLEKCVNTCGDFGASFVRLLTGGDQSDAISTSNAFAHTIAQLLHNAKGLTRLTPDEDLVEELIEAARQSALSGRWLLERLQSPNLSSLSPEQRVETVSTYTRDAIVGLLGMQPLLEKIGPESSINTAGGVDLGDAVEREMQAAARAIEEAARRLENLVAENAARALQGGLDMGSLHTAVLGAAVALTKAIGQLIKCATDCQHEIVAHGRGNAGNAAFYKKNNKWTEGLVSAAKSVAEATTMLVECADGLVKGTHKMEQLIVAAQEVGVSTTQLVSAARVKAVPFSKVQDRLEEAAVAVREATKLLVKAARDAAKLKAEESAREEIGKIGRHEMKIREMEQQVKILELEKELSQARYKLGELRKAGYSDV
ncbi:sla2 Src-like adaptor 2 [Chytridiales sp. JEL 0842]|nr:sla2 Src-like adaptor 2 [Chytridiales sp. JEL 0842]